MDILRKTNGNKSLTLVPTIKSKNALKKLKNYGTELRI